VEYGFEAGGFDRGEPGHTLLISWTKSL